MPDHIECLLVFSTLPASHYHSPIVSKHRSPFLPFDSSGVILQDEALQLHLGVSYETINLGTLVTCKSVINAYSISIQQGSGDMDFHYFSGTTNLDKGRGKSGLLQTEKMHSSPRDVASFLTAFTPLLPNKNSLSYDHFNATTLQMTLLPTSFLLKLEISKS